jgi:peroxiredoxin
MILKSLLLFVLNLAILGNGVFETSGLGIGDKASDFNLMNVDGSMVSLDDFKDAKGYIVIFTCNTCPYAKAYESRIIALHNKYAPRGFPVIAINPNSPDVQPGDSFEAMKERASSKKFPFPYLQDESQAVAKNYGATKTPHVYLLDANKTVAYIGAIDNNHRDITLADKKYLEDAVDALLNDTKVPLEETKAVGCGIKWKDA